MRIPSIHVSETKLLQELTKLCSKYNLSSYQLKTLAEDLIGACKKHSLSHRSLSISNDKLLRQSKKIVSSEISNASLFAELLYLHRQKLKHVGVLRVKPGQKDWLEIKDLTSLADQFVAEFNLEIRAGYISYLTLGMQKMKKFSTGKLKSLHSAICQDYDAKQKIDNDKTPALTRKAYEIYRDLITKKTGIPDIGYDLFPEKYAVFIEVKQAAEAIGIDVGKYIQAQFDALNYKDGVPDPLQLIGPKAYIKVQTYCFENNINLKTKKTINFQNIK